jgi:formate C-acetyltransferase
MGLDGGSQWNDLSDLVVEAATLVQMPEPVILIRVDPGARDDVKSKTARACLSLGGQASVINDAVVVPNLINLGVSPQDSHDYSMVGCHRLDLPGRMDSVGMMTYHYHDLTKWLLAALHGGRNPVTGEAWVEGVKKPSRIGSLEDLLEQFRKVCAFDLHEAVSAARRNVEQAGRQASFQIESLLIRDCVSRGSSASRGGARYIPQGHFLGGIATVANALEVIKHVVFEERRCELAELMQIVDADFAGHESLRHELADTIPKYGNDLSGVDCLAGRAGGIVLDALEDAAARENQMVFTGFYSLDQHHRWGKELPATPDGRRRGEPISENQSPVYGTDTTGVTALLRSAACLPLRRTVMGTLNVRFAGPIPPENLESLINAYFKLGGLCLGFNFVTAEELRDAQAHPERHRSLCVRLYGFSEYFVSLGPEEQEEVIRRTAFC